MGIAPGIGRTTITPQKHDTPNVKYTGRFRRVRRDPPGSGGGDGRGKRKNVDSQTENILNLHIPETHSSGCMYVFIYTIILYIAVCRPAGRTDFVISTIGISTPPRSRCRFFGRARAQE